MLVRVKVLPDDITVSLDELTEKIINKLPAGSSLLKKVQEPIAFGLSALILDIKIKESEGVLDTLEASIKDVEHVSQVDVVGVSRLSTPL
ncbi:MAG: elongation factor 1-beta [Nitrososphaerales archaeon]